MIISGVLGPAELILILCIPLFFLLLPIIAIVDILRSRFEGNNNVLFLLIVILLPIVGSILYFIIGPSRKVRY
ncbi:MAG: PLDc N-terminal domain-containing protein [Bacteroidales bacterium]